MIFLTEEEFLNYFSPFFHLFFADSDPAIQNVANPTDPDPDPKHCMYLKKIVLIIRNTIAVLNL